jgi:hypothetical protein
MTCVDVAFVLASFALGVGSTSAFCEAYYREKMEALDREIMSLKEDNFWLNQKLLSR